MDENSLKYFKNKLIREKEGVNSLLQEMKNNESIDSNSAINMELSNYDNHPADTGSELFEKEKGLALKENQISIIKKINDGLKNIEDGSYGICKGCGKNIPKERLELVPYAELCIKCQDKISEKNINEIQRPVEEEVLGYPFGYGYNDKTTKVEFDAEDCYQSVEFFNKIKNMHEYYNVQEEEDLEEEGYVEPVEKISNEYYKSTLE
ncbi:TraR/DksA C4-type zinc finger protein [Clostridium sp. Marseille-Q2269]|uniref:TraR/DksA C4-type zinc finger protein n=1 Tax=Clostridium sp. Marseille-Q2269 TaxID=2942205 RepID=UPI00207398B0|nr:TraR/DksA C4-type zinc finger protein [Clostridium sp. Marseille-Q2269]